jgi:hypothetical protein
VRLEPSRAGGGRRSSGRLCPMLSGRLCPMLTCPVFGHITPWPVIGGYWPTLAFRP